MPIIQGTAASEALSGAEGADSVVGGAGHDTLDDGLEFLGWGMAVGADLLLGGDGNDILYGYDGADTLSGGNGQDELWSLTDADTLLGGAGLDTAVIDRSLTDIGITFAA